MVSIDFMDSWRKTHDNIELANLPEGSEVTLMGWLQEVRDLGRIKFLVLRDSSGIAQVTIKVGEVPPNIMEKIAQVTRESVIAIKGKVQKTEKSKLGFEVIPIDVKVLNISKVPLPLEVSGKVPADFETRMNSRFMDLRRPTEVAVFKIQHEVLKTIRRFLDERGFIEVITPKILATATEGGAQLFKLQYFEKDAFLAQSPQLYKEVLTSCFERVYEIGVYFRAEESNTPFHLNEFVSVDIEAAFMDYKDVMRILEDCIVHVHDHISKSCHEELRKLSREIRKPQTPFPVLTYSKAVDLLREKGLDLNWGTDLTTTALRLLAEEMNSYYFIIDWPTETKPFYIKPHPNNPMISESFDLMWQHIELASGGTRIHIREELEKSIRSKGLNVDSFREHLRAFDYGMPPHAGWGLGLSRLIMVLTGRQNIREVVLFPRDRTRLTP
ncbi:MAG: aspartate--tRNA(Asn) ligase [Candidatus Nezhaarchaeota archaeon]|nr:aspartate--tRNA(Asn) ligase [Candidatus Nezhaarchaeota archaeon]MCX8141925.1 aspartate--tRNA(Asn) ligase [Candidatus Nezhaarchaeota archaeon]MDW8050294.1 aspartate--tRNA(Asn) ligase [Nitrososphaerota archaeon]